MNIQQKNFENYKKNFMIEKILKILGGLQVYQVPKNVDGYG